jgi:hypothetical protein
MERRVLVKETTRMKLRVLVASIAVLVALAGLPFAASAQTVQTVGLHMQGVTVVNETGKRFVFAGINIEMFRDYYGCGWVTNGQYAIREVVADNLHEMGVNTVRVNYTRRFLEQGNNFIRFLEMIEEFTKRGLYVMPTDHSYSGRTLESAQNAYPMMQRIVEGMRERDLEAYLIMNPFNEPGPTVRVPAWIQAQKDVLTFLRETAKFDGIVALDGNRWATMLDVESFKAIMSFDAELRGGTSNVIFSNHLYPNIRDLPAKMWTTASQVPLMVGELGQYNPGASPITPNYVKSVIAGAFETGIPNGHNGLFAWLYAWCDSNRMLEDWENGAKPYTEESTLTSYGEIWRDEYYGKMPDKFAMPSAKTPEVEITATPTGN